MRIAVLVSSLLLFAAPLDAQPRVGVVVVAHGANEEWNAQVREVVRKARIAGPVEVSFLMGPEAKTTRFQDVVRSLVTRRVAAIVVVPLLVSSHSEHYQQVRYLAGLADSVDRALHAHMDHGGLEPIRLDIPIVVTPALDDAPVLAEVLAERSLALSRAPTREALFLVGHGPGSAEDYAHWMRNLRVVADSLRRRVPFADIRLDLVRDDAPPHVRAEAVTRVRELIDLQHQVTGDTVVVVPVLLSRGRVSRETFLKDLTGLPVRYSGDPLMPHAGLSRWLEERVRDAVTAREPLNNSLLRAR